MPSFSARAALLLTLTLVASVAMAQPRQYSEGGYADRHSVAVGEMISFHIASSRSPFTVEIVNMASPTTVLGTIPGLNSQVRDCTGLWEGGCQWPVTTTFTVPSHYTPGYYAARFPTGVGVRHILFVVRAIVPGSYAPIAVIQPSFSDVAYNRFGGKSVYDTISDDGQRAYIVSFDRPYYDDAGLSRFQIWESRFVSWMKAENRKFEVITDHDMEAGISLAGYKAVIIVGHSEYWTLNGRRRLEAYSRSGGHVAIFGANTMWWQVRVDLQSRQLTVYKDPALDPFTGTDKDLVTTNFTDWPVLNPENSILGASFLNAAYVNKLPNGDRVPVEERVPYTVRKPGHWVFAGTGLTNGATMGRSIAAVEVDGALFNTLPDGSVVVEGSDGTPLSYEILATLPASDGYATIGFYANPQGGGVFSGAARDWSYGLADDAVIQTMTRNVLDRLATGQPFPYQPRVTPNRLEDLFNTPLAAPDFLPGWRYLKLGFNLAPRCAREGPTGLDLTSSSWTQVLRNIAVGRTGLTKAAANIWVNADFLTASATFPTPLVSFVDYRGPGSRAVAALEILDRPEGRSLRVSSFNGSAYVASTAWVPLSPGWHSVQFAWESPGQLELNVSGTKVSAFNTKSDQRMNSVMLEFAGRYMSGSVCVDQLQLRDVFAPASTATSVIEATPATIGFGETAAVIVRLADAGGNPLVNGGDDVTLSTTLGTLSDVIDNGDGTYSATFSSGSTGGVATISATVNGLTIEQTATVTISGAAAFGPPNGLTASGVSPGAVNVSWQPVEGAARYELFRRDEDGPFELLTSTSTTSVVDTAVTGGKAYLYYVRAISGTGEVSGGSAIDLATTVFFTDDPLVAQVTVVKAIHITELRIAINALRDTAGLGPTSFTDGDLVGQPIRAVHVQELRDALAAARSAAGLPEAPLTAPPPATGGFVRAAHLQELRDALK